MKKNQFAVAATAETEIVSIVMPSPSMDAAGRINYFHNVSKQAGKVSIKAAIFAGLELARVKASLPHGEYQNWIVANCSFKYSTAHNYIAIAYRLISDTELEFDDLLEDTDTARIGAVETASSACETNSLTELYVDLGIVKKSKSNLGGFRQGAGRKSKEEKAKMALAAQAAAQDGELAAKTVEGMISELYRVLVIEDAIGDLDEDKLQSVNDSLMNILDKVNARQVKLASQNAKR